LEWTGHVFAKCHLLCDGTGWLRERPDDGGYTGINIVETEAKIEGGKLKIKAKLWSPGDVLPFTEALASEAGVSKLEAMNGW